VAVNMLTRVTYNATHSRSDFVAILRTCFGTDDEGPSVPDDASSDHEPIRGLDSDGRPDRESGWQEPWRCFSAATSST